MQKSGVVLGVHDAEADVFAVQTFEGGAVADHETLVDAGVEDVLGGQAGLLDFQEEEVGVGRVCAAYQNSTQLQVCVLATESPGTWNFSKK